MYKQMTDNIFDFKSKKKKSEGDTPPPTPYVHEDLVEGLEHMLEQAKLGNIVHISGAMEWIDGTMLGVDFGFPEDMWRFWAGLHHNSLEYREFYLASPPDLE
jgi:hypothetical protein